MVLSWVECVGRKRSSAAKVCAYAAEGARRRRW